MATTTTQKAKNFQGTPLKELELKDVPGVGEVSLGKLQDANIDTSIGLMGQFFLFKMKEQAMIDWLKDTCGIEEQFAKKTVEALAEKAKKLVEK